MPTSLDRFRGSLLGLAVGDAFGRRYEGLPPELMVEHHHQTVETLLNDIPQEIRYTDDTQMMIGVAETLLELGHIDEEHLAVRFAANYEPWRGYGRGARVVLEAIEEKRDWQSIARKQFAGGSFGNGAAMRVAPVGLFFSRDLARVANEATLSSLPTHTHELGIDGARLLALAVAKCFETQDKLDRQKFLADLRAHARTEEFRQRFETALTLSTPDELPRLGNGIAALDSVVTAISCFAFSPESFPTAIGLAILLGGDTDTIAAMTGACSGAYLGVAAVSPALLTALEDGPKGHAYISDLAERLHDRSQQ